MAFWSPFREAVDVVQHSTGEVLVGHSSARSIGVSRDAAQSSGIKLGSNPGGSAPAAVARDRSGEAAEHPQHLSAGLGSRNPPREGVGTTPAVTVLLGMAAGSLEWREGSSRTQQENRNPVHSKLPPLPLPWLCFPPQLPP